MNLKIVSFLVIILALFFSRCDAQKASFEAIGDLPGGAFNSSVKGVSDDGRVIVGYATDSSGEKAFRWTSQTGMVVLGNLKNQSFKQSWANRVSADGNVIVGYGDPSVTNDGTLFFGRNGNWNEGRIMYATFSNGKYNTPVDIGLPVNKGGALHAYVASDKSYMLFNSPREGSNTKLDIWISFRKPDGLWSDPKNLGKKINSGADAILCPTVSSDGKYLFFIKLNLTTHTGYVYWVNILKIEEISIKLGATNNENQ